MIEHRLDTADGILYMRPKAAFEKKDFEQIAAVIDPFIKEKGDLAGFLIEVPAFPGWDSFGAMAAHFRFLKDHHKHIKKIALVTDAAVGTVAEKLGSHFVAATIKHFPAGQTEAARQWITGQTQPESQAPNIPFASHPNKS